MKINALLAAMLLSGSIAFAQVDPVIMTINGAPVTRSEFEYSYNKNNSEGVIDKKTVGEYVDLFVNYKLKVQAALDARLDTLSSFKKEFATYRDQQIRPSMITEQDVENEAHRIYEDTRQRIDGNGGMVKVSHILLMLGQKATPAENAKLKSRADSIYAVLKKGGNFAELAKKFSDDKSTAVKGGELPWISKGQTVKAFEDAAYSLKVGEISKPVLSEFGYHIIKKEGTQNFFPYDSLRTDIIRFIDARGIREKIINDKLDSLAKSMPAGTTAENILDKKAEELSAKDSDLKNLIREYHDGLLLYEISNRLVWDKASKDEKGQAAYFAKNKKRFKWNEPRFKGIAYHVKDAADVEAVKKSIKGKAFSEWADILRNTFNKDSVIRIRVEKGIFKKGDNAVVDKMVFKKDTTVKALKDYPIDATFGKVLKKAPEDYTDVKSQVIADYQDMLENTPFDDALYMLEVTGDQLKRMVQYVLRDEAWEGHTEFYQFSKGFHVKYRKSTRTIEEFTWQGREIAPDDRLKIALQNYHYKNFDEFFHVPLEEVKQNMRPRVVATSVNNIYEEYFSTNDRLDAHVEGRIEIVE